MDIRLLAAGLVLAFMVSGCEKPKREVPTPFSYKYSSEDSASTNALSSAGTEKVSDAADALPSLLPVDTKPAADLTSPAQSPEQKADAAAEFAPQPTTPAGVSSPLNASAGDTGTQPDAQPAGNETLPGAQEAVAPATPDNEPSASPVAIPESVVMDSGIPAAIPLDIAAEFPAAQATASEAASLPDAFEPSLPPPEAAATVAGILGSKQTISSADVTGGSQTPPSSLNAAEAAPATVESISKALPLTPEPAQNSTTAL